MSQFSYFTAQTADKFNFIQVPKDFFTNPNFYHLSTDAKMLYAILLDRVSLSKKNGWVDKVGHVYIIFKQEDISINLNCSKPKATKIMAELANIGLIEKVKQGMNRPDIIYVKNFNSEEHHVDDAEEISLAQNAEVKKVNCRKLKKLISESKNSLRLNNTNKSNTEKAKLKTIIKKEDEEQSISCSNSMCCNSPKIVSNALDSGVAHKSSLSKLNRDTSEYLQSYTDNESLRNMIADFILLRKKEKSSSVWIKRQLRALNSCYADYDKEMILDQAIRNDWKNLPSRDILCEWQQHWTYFQL